MKNSKVFILDNGLKLVFYQDKTKHNTIANLFVKFGGSNKNFKINNKQYIVKNGMAHFLEHILIEHSIYENVLIEFDKNHTISNGFTTNLMTEFYINSVCNFEEDLVKLIKIVNQANFNSNDVLETKKAIIKEKMMSKDNHFVDLEKITYKCLFENIKYPNILGEVEDISSITMEDLKLCYETFYQPKNQVLIISGNFDDKKIKELVINTYKDINIKEVKYEIEKFEEKNQVLKKQDNIIKDVYNDFVSLNYKVDISNLTNKEQVKLTFYLNYYLNYLFGPSSKLYNEMVKDEICSYNISCNYNKIDKFIIVKIGNNTDKSEEFIKRIDNAIQNKEVNENDFELKKKKSIINIILREDNLFSMIGPFIDNIIYYDYNKIDTIEDIENQNFIDYKNTINKLDFTNYCITKIVKEKIKEKSNVK